MNFSKYLLTEESYKIAKFKWIHQGHDPKEVEGLLARFKELKNQHRIQELDKKDIAYWLKKDPKDLENYLNDVVKKLSKKEKDIEGSKNIITVLDTPEISIVIPKTFEASCYLAQGKTKWCTASSGGEPWVKGYIQNYGYTIYYIHFKKTGNGPEGERYAVTVKYDGTIKSIWNKENEQIFPTKQNEDDPGKTKLYKKLHILGLDIDFKTLVKSKERTESRLVSSDKIREYIKEEDDKLNFFKDEDASVREHLTKFLIHNLKTTELSDKYVKHGSAGKKAFVKKLFKDYLKSNKVNDTDKLHTLIDKIIILYIRDFGGKLEFSLVGGE